MHTRARGKPSSGDLLAAAALCVGIALAFVTNPGFSALNDADSVLLAYNSLQRLTVFMWEQNRLGNLVPLLAKPVPTIFANELTQIFLRALFGAGSLVGLLWLAGTRRNLGALLAAVLVWLIAIQWWRSNSIYLQETPPYAQSVALFALACAALDANARHGVGRMLIWAAGVVLIGAVFWVNLGAVVMVAPYLAIGLVFHRDGAWLRRCLGAALGAGFGYWLMTRQPGDAYAAANIGLAPLWRSLSRFAECYNAAPLALLTPLLVMAAVLTVFRPRRNEPQDPILGVDRAAYLGLAVSALLYVPIVGQLGWVAHNDFDHRYFVLSAAILGVLATLALAAGTVLLARSSGNALRRAALPLLVVAAGVLWVACYGLPARGFTANWYAAPARERVPALAAANTFLVAGGYQQGWSTLFELQRAYERNRGPGSALFFSLSHRPANILDQAAARMADLYAREGRVTIGCIDNPTADCRNQIERISMLPVEPTGIACGPKCQLLAVTRPAAPSGPVSFLDPAAKPWLSAGWLEPAPNGSLSKMPVTRLVFAVVPGTAALRLTVANIIGKTEGPLTLTLRVRALEPRDLTLPADGAPTIITLPLPAAATLGGVADVEFRAAATASPKRLGWSADDGTPLAFSLLTAEAVPGPQ